MSAPETPLLGPEATAELLALAQEAGRVGVFEWYVPQGKISLAPMALSLFGLESFDGRYESWMACIFREDRIRVTHTLDAAFADQSRQVQVEFRIAQPGKKDVLWLEARYLAFYGHDGRVARVVGVCVDITERKAALMQLRTFTESLEDAVRERTRELEKQNEARRHAEEALRQAQKMEAVGQLTGGIAHDFNNLLTIVMGGLDVIGRQLPNLADSAVGARIARARDMSLEGVQRAVTLTSRLLAFSRQQPLLPKPLDVNALVASACAFIGRAIGEQVSLETVQSAGLWPAFVDGNELENALLNLAINARDAMPGGGKLTIETANCYLDDEYLQGVAEPVERGQYVLIAIADTGTGMDKATLERVFDPFFTTKEVGKGTGLGLSQVYGFVRQSSGHVRVYSELGEGTTVKLYLPRHRGPHPAVEARQSDMPAQRATSGETVLLVEDDPALRRYTSEMLEELGYVVVQAATGAQALEMLAKSRPVDLLFTDVVMPGGMNGRQLATAAVERQPSLKVLFTTGYTRNAIIHHGRLDEGVELISKPYSMLSLAQKLRSVLDS